MKNTKICIVSSGLSMGGIERATSNLANGLKLLGKEVIFIALFNTTPFFSLVEDIKFIQPNQFNHKKLSFFKTIFWIRTLLKKENPDIIIVYSIFYAALVSLAILGTKRKIFLSERSSPLYKWSKHVRFVNRVAFKLKKPKGIIAQTSIAAKYQRNYYGSSIPFTIAPNAVKEIQLYSSIKREEIILAVGRFNDPLKGFDRLIEAFAKIKNKKWVLIFAGGDKDGEYLKQQARQLNIYSRIKFLGRVENLDKIYAQASIFVIPSRSEGFPNALCEAMAAGLACISFDFIAGSRDIIKDRENGYLVENGNIEQLAKTIDLLIDNKKERLRIGMNALTIRSKQSIEAQTKQILKFVTETIGN